jgi:predicted amidohydrolase YtcJ
VACALTGSAAARAPEPADLVLRGGAIYTVAAVRSWAKAVGVRDGSIVYVGSDAGAEPFIGDGTRVVDLRGRLVLPAFQDVHIHPISSGIQAATCDIGEYETQEEYLQAVAKYAAEHPDEAWISGGGWSMDAFPSAIPDGRLLDEIVPDRPVFLSSTDGHSAWVNSKALEIAGITKETPDPSDGRIDRDPETGEPIGALQEGAMSLVGKHLPPVTPEERADGLRYALEMLNGYGITSIQDAAVGAEGLETYRQLDERGELTARVVASQWWEPALGEEQLEDLIERRERFTRGRLHATTIKIMQDGVMENHTAVMLKPYIGKPGVTGIPMFDPKALKKIVTLLDREGFQVHFHAIGDGAIRQVLDAVEAARTKNGDRGNRHHVSHIQLFDPADIPRFRELDVVANFQPLWAFAEKYITDLAIPFLGPERSRWLYPIGSLQRSGAVVAFGSDWSVSTANPFEEIEVAVTRMGPKGETREPFLPEERIDLPSAIAAFTINAAYVNSLERRTGSIEVGKLADLIVVDRNLFAIDPTEISEARVLLTLLEGTPVHGDFSLRN